MSTPFTIVSVEPASENWKRSLCARARVRIADAVQIELELLEGKNGVFVVYPSRREKRHDQDGWCSLVQIVDRDLEKAIFKAVRDEFSRREERAKETAVAPASMPDPQTDSEFPRPTDLPF